MNHTNYPSYNTDTDTMSNTVYLITGASRGIGKALVETFIARPNTTVIAAVRDPSAASSKSLNSLRKGPSSELIIIALDSSDESGASKAVSELQSKHSISHIDVVIANAGISEDFSPIAKMPLASLKKHVEVNSYGPVTLFQAVLPLLEKSKQQKFVGVGSPLGSIGGMDQRPYPMSAYGMSKALLHYLVRKVHLEHENITAFVVDPGFVQTDMGNTGAQMFGMEKATDTVEDSVGGLVKEIDGATKEKTSGHFRIFTGDEFPW